MMSHSDETTDSTRRAPRDGGSSPESGRDWDADTTVMPPEYCRQLLEISRQLRHGK